MYNILIYFFIFIYVYLLVIYDKVLKGDKIDDININSFIISNASKKKEGEKKCSC